MTRIHSLYGKVPEMPESIKLRFEARWSWGKPYYSIDGGRTWHTSTRKALDLSAFWCVRFA